MTSAFSDLIAEYPTWTALSAHLSSAEGGKLRIIQNAESPLAIIRYTRGISDFTMSHVPLFRSVVWNTVTHRPVSVAPPKAEDGFPPTDIPLTVTEFVDGTMMQCFRTKTSSAAEGQQEQQEQQGQQGQQIQIATRTSLGAHGTFYSKRSFAELFADSMEPFGGLVSFLDSVLAENSFISCVLQHPEHLTVEYVAEPRFVVTHVGTVTPDGGVEMTSDPEKWPARLIPYGPKTYSEDGSEWAAFLPDAKAVVQAISKDSNYTFQGLVFTGPGGRRWRIRNPAYMVVRALRGQESNPVDRYLRLRKQSQVKEYLTYFRGESEATWGSEQSLRAVTQVLYDAYVAVHKVKSAEFKSFHVSLRPHIYALHGMYLTSVANGIPKPILKESVIGYVNALAIPDQANLIRWFPTMVAEALVSAASASDLAVSEAHAAGIQIMPGVQTYASVAARH